MFSEPAVLLTEVAPAAPATTAAIAAAITRNLAMRFLCMGSSPEKRVTLGGTSLWQRNHTRVPVSRGTRRARGAADDERRLEHLHRPAPPGLLQAPQEEQRRAPAELERRLGDRGDRGLHHLHPRDVVERDERDVARY